MKTKAIRTKPFGKWKSTCHTLRRGDERGVLQIDDETGRVAGCGVLPEVINLPAATAKATLKAKGWVCEMSLLYKATESLPEQFDEYDLTACAIADAVVDDWRAERDPTPLTLDLLVELGWKKDGDFIAYKFFGMVEMFAVSRGEQVLLYWGSFRLKDNATLGDLRTLERLLAKEAK